MHIIHFLGAPGAGKTTTIDRICRNYSTCANFYIGRIVREEVFKETQLGKEMKLLLERGEVLSANMTLHLLQHEIGVCKEAGVGVLLVDGFPRSAEQAASYLEHIGPPTLTIYLAAAPAVASERLMARLNSSDARVDDTQKIVHKRLENIEAHVKPGLDVYRARGCVIETIDASRSADEVYALVTETLKRHNIL